MRLLLGVSGGIAAYKACELVRIATKAGAEVRVVMTEHATRFVGPLTFETLSGHPVLLDTFQGGESGTIDHIAWAKWPTVAAVAPLTANTLGKLACGLADDALSTVMMALPRGVPVVLGPAMNTEMWFNPVVQRNLAWLADLGRYTVVEPIDKALACGDVGRGGLAEPETLWQALQEANVS